MGGINVAKAGHPTRLVERGGQRGLPVGPPVLVRGWCECGWPRPPPPPTGSWPWARMHPTPNGHGRAGGTAAWARRVQHMTAHDPDGRGGRVPPPAPSTCAGRANPPPKTTRLEAVSVRPTPAAACRGVQGQHTHVHVQRRSVGSDRVARKSNCPLASAWLLVLPGGVWSVDRMGRACAWPPAAPSSTHYLQP